MTEERCPRCNRLASPNHRIAGYYPGRSDPSDQRWVCRECYIWLMGRVMSDEPPKEGRP